MFVIFPCEHFLQDFSPPYINILNLSIVGQSLENFKETYFTIELNLFCSKGAMHHFHCEKERKET